MLLFLLVTMGKLLPMRRAAESESLSDEGLVAACALGDHAALGLLFSRLHPRVYRFLSRYVGHDHAALDDLVQATFLEALQAAPRFRRESSVLTWLLAIASNVARNHVRGEVRRRAFLGRLTECPTPTVTRPDDVAVRQELLGRLGAALTELPPDLRTAFVMCDLEELSGVEVARAIGVREGTLWRRLHDARKRLRQSLDREAGR